MEVFVSVDLSGGQSPLLLFWKAYHFIFIFCILFIIHEHIILNF